MDIRCNSCGTEYVFDEDQIPPEGVRVKCEVCQNIFHVIDPELQEEEEQEEDEDDEKVFTIRQPSGKKLEFTDLETLHDWIREGVVSTKDAISSTGDSWVLLGHLPELKELFASVQQSEDPFAQESTVELVRHPLGEIEPDDSDPQYPVGMDDLIPQDDMVEPDFGSDLRPADGEDLFAEDAPFVRTERSRWPWVVGLLVLILGTSLGGLFYLDLLPNPFVKGAKGGGIDRETTPIKDGPYLKNALVLMKGGSRAAFQDALKALAECPTPRCFARKSLLHSMIGYTYYLELKIMEQKLLRLGNRAVPPTTWPVEKAALLKGILGETQEAEALAKTALSMENLSPPEARIALLLADIVRSRPMERSRIAQLEGIYATNIFAQLSLAISHLLGQQYGKTIKTLQQIAKLDREQVLTIPILQLQIWTALAQGQNERASKALKTHCAKRPEMKFYCTLAAQKLDPAPPPSEISTIQKAQPTGKAPRSRPHPNHQEEQGDYDSFYMQAQQAYKLGNKTKAKAYYLKAARKDPTSADPLNGVGWCHMDGGNYAGAITFFKKALALVPHFGRARYGLAEAYLRAGKKQAALTQYRAYISRHAAGRHAPRARLQITSLEADLKPKEPGMAIVIMKPVEKPPEKPKAPPVKRAKPPAQGPSSKSNPKTDPKPKPAQNPMQQPTSKKSPIRAVPKTSSKNHRPNTSAS